MALKYVENANIEGKIEKLVALYRRQEKRIGEVDKTDVAYRHSLVGETAGEISELVTDKKERISWLKKAGQGYDEALKRAGDLGEEKRVTVWHKKIEVGLTLWELTQNSRYKKSLVRECDRFIGYLDEIRNFQYGRIYARADQIRTKISGRRTRGIEAPDKARNDQKELLKKTRRKNVRKRRNIRKKHDIRTAKNKKHM